MLESEIAEARGADLLVHLNIDESRLFTALLPGHAHVLLYPHIPSPFIPAELPPFVLIVAAANYPNYVSVKWFLS